MTGAELTILEAATNILRAEALERVTAARDFEERHCANTALLASVTIEAFLKLRNDLDRPF